MSRSIRFATEADMRAIRDIELAADSLFEEIFGPAPFGENSAPEGSDRAGDPGFLLVAAEGDGEPALGFVHVLEIDGAHLEQLAVLPEYARSGHGRALVEAAADEASARNHEYVTLRTYANISWNQPFYEMCGFAVISPIDSAFHTQLVLTEENLDLGRHGPRVLMSRTLQPRPTDGVG